MPRKLCNHPQPLRDLCTANVAQNLDNVGGGSDYSENFLGTGKTPCLYVMGPLDALPSNLIEDIYVHLVTKCAHRVKLHHLYLLLSYSMKILDLRAVSKLTNRDSLLKFVAKKGQTLEELNLRALTKLSASALHVLVSRITNITSLDMSSTKCDGTVLKALSQSCKTIRELKLSQCTLVDDTGLLSLCYFTPDCIAFEESVPCPLISILHVDGTSTSLKCWIHVMMRLRLLAEFHYSSVCSTGYLIEQACQLDTQWAYIASLPLPGRSLRVYSIVIGSVNDTHSKPIFLDTSQPSELAPRVSKLTINETTDICDPENVNHIHGAKVCLDNYSSFRNLTDIEYTQCSSRNQPPEVFVHLLKLCGGQLLNLKLVTPIKYSLVVIASLCRNVHTFSYVCIEGLSNITTDEMQVEEPLEDIYGAWTELTSLQLVNHMDNSNDNAFDAEEIVSVLKAAHVVKNIHFHKHSFVTRAMFTQIMEVNPLLCLETIDLQFIQSLQLSLVHLFLKSSNQVRRIDLTGSSGIFLRDVEKMRFYIDQHGYDVDIIFDADSGCESKYCNNREDNMNRMLAWMDGHEEDDDDDHEHLF